MAKGDATQTKLLRDRVQLTTQSASNIARRLAAHGLSTRASTVTLACKRMLALQAQDFTQACWALAVRTESATHDDVAKAFASRELVRAWTLRGTLHVMPAEDLPWLIGMLKERNLKRAARRISELRISEADVLAARKVVEKALPGRTLTRDALHTLFEAAGQAAAKQRGVYLLFCLTQAGVLCQAGEEFALAEEWISRPRKLEGDEALGELARRYRVGHGPATLEDFAFWTGLPKRDAKRGWEIAGAVESADYGIPPVLLLPGYDEYFIAYADRASCIDEADFMRVVPGGNGVFLPMLVIDGRVRGTWGRRKIAKGVTLTLRPFAPLTDTQLHAFERAARAYGAYIGAPVVLKLDD
jgi:hypothetical protein